MDLLRLSIGSHDPAAQIFANRFLPVGVFNLSITAPDVIEETNARMAKVFHPDGGPWRRAYMPRTVLVFINDDRPRARRANGARRPPARANYWRALEGTLDPARIKTAGNNALVGDPGDRRADARALSPRRPAHAVVRLQQSRFEAVMRNMELFMEPGTAAGGEGVSRSGIAMSRRLRRLRRRRRPARPPSGDSGRGCRPRLLSVGAAGRLPAQRRRARTRSTARSRG